MWPNTISESIVPKFQFDVLGRLTESADLAAESAWCLISDIHFGS